MSRPITLIARFRAKSGQETKLAEELQHMLEPTRAEEGCLSYELHESTGEPGLFLFYETWESQDALDKHFESPHLQALLKQVPTLVEGRPDITKWTIVKQEAK